MLNFLKPWSEESGIHYSLWPEKNGEEMPDLPVCQSFSAVTIGARRDVASLWELLDWIFNIIVGKHYDLYKDGFGQKGIFDYLILPLVARKLVSDCYLPERKGAYLKNTISFGISAPLELARIAIGLAISIVLLPAVLLMRSCCFNLNFPSLIPACCRGVSPRPFYELPQKKRGNVGSAAPLLAQQ